VPTTGPSRVSPHPGCQFASISTEPSWPVSQRAGGPSFLFFLNGPRTWEPLSQLHRNQREKIRLPCGSCQTCQVRAHQIFSKLFHCNNIEPSEICMYFRRKAHNRSGRVLRPRHRRGCYTRSKHSPNLLVTRKIIPPPPPCSRWIRCICLTLARAAETSKPKHPPGSNAVEPPRWSQASAGDREL